MLRLDLRQPNHDGPPAFTPSGAMDVKVFFCVRRVPRAGRASQVSPLHLPSQTVRKGASR